VSGNTLNVSSTLMCPHGGTVQIISANTRVKTGGALAALATDTFTISGCPYQIPTPVPIPSPCVLVQWIVPDARNRASGNFTLSQSSTGLCMSATGIPQGTVSVVNTQSQVRSS
jgi:hypothetical protein